LQGVNHTAHSKEFSNVISSDLAGEALRCYAAEKPRKGYEEINIFYLEQDASDL